MQFARPRVGTVLHGMRLPKWTGFWVQGGRSPLGGDIQKHDCGDVLIFTVQVCLPQYIFGMHPGISFQA